MSSPELSETSIPIIDISNPSPEVAQQVLAAASTHGFLFIKNDGVTIPQADIDAMFDLSSRFFKSPKEVKQEYAIHSEKAGGINKGWVSMQGEALDPETQKQGDPKEAFNIAPPSPTTPLQPLPAPLSLSTPLISRFQNSCHALCQQILSLLNTALQIPDPEYFTSRHDQKLGKLGSMFRLLYYPATEDEEPRKESETANRGDAKETKVLAGAHSDYGSITLLFRLPGQPGLELLHPKTNSWIPVPVDPSNPSPSSNTPPPILTNIGDLLSFWTSGLLRSTVHRVVHTSGVERYSMAYFCHPLDDTKLDAVPSPLIEKREANDEESAEQWRRIGFLGGEDGEEKGQGKRVMTAKQHLDRRLKVTYGL